MAYDWHTEDLSELLQRITELEIQVDHWHARAQGAEMECDRLALQLLLQKELTNGHKLLGDANASMRDAVLHLVKEEGRL